MWIQGVQSKVKGTSMLEKESVYHVREHAKIPVQFVRRSAAVGVAVLMVLCWMKRTNDAFILKPVQGNVSDICLYSLFYMYTLGTIMGDHGYKHQLFVCTHVSFR